VSNKGFTLIELLVAMVILGVALAGLVSLWAFGFNTTAHSQDIGVAYSVARQEVEKVRNIGYSALQETIPDSTSYYDGLGNIIIGANPEVNPSTHFKAITVVHTIPINGQTSLPTAYLRTVNIKITPHGPAKEGTELLFETTTYLTLDGI